MERPASSSTNTRTAWCPLIVKTNQSFEVHILWKSSRNVLRLYQTQKSGEFGRVVSAHVNTEKNDKGEETMYYIFQNEYGVRIHFRLSLFSPALIGSNELSKKFIELRCETEGDAKIARFLTNLVSSKNFSHFDENLNVKKDNEDEEEFRGFYAIACDNAVIVTAGVQEAVETLAQKTNRRKKADVSKPQSKQSKINKFFNEELKDPKGVEKQHVAGFHNRQDIHIDKLEICTDIQLPIDENKVKMIAKNMMERFDPSLVILTVVPRDPELHTEGPNNMYLVVHGRHRLLALKHLKSENKLQYLPMMMNETLTCFILGMTAASSLNYASLRGNELAAKFVSKPNHHDMTQIIVGLVKSVDDREEVVKIIGRYINLLKWSEVLKAAIRNICKWPQDCLELLSKVLLKYECYQTLDTDTRTMQRSNKKLMEGLKLEVPMLLFKEIARFPSEFFRDNADSILNGQKSLKELVNEFKMSEERKKKVAKIEESAGFEKIDVLRQTFPLKFTNDILDKLPPVRPVSDKASVIDKTFIVNYTKTVMKERGTESRTDLDDLRYLEAEQDVHDLKRLLKYAKRDNVKKELQSSIQKFQTILETIKPPTDPYKFSTSPSAVGTNVIKSEKENVLM